MHLINDKKKFLFIFGLLLSISITIIVTANVVSTQTQESILEENNRLIVKNNIIDETKQFVVLKTYLHFHGWYEKKYDNWDCSEKSEACLDYIQNKLDIPCILVYGQHEFTAHKWIMVFIYDSWHEFETTSFVFKTISCSYDEIFAQTVDEVIY